jgi:hypothetical protein
MAAMTRLSFNIGPYGKNVQKSSPLKPVSQFLKQTWLEWSLGGQLSKLCPVIPTSIQDSHRQWI